MAHPGIRGVIAWGMLCAGSSCVLAGGAPLQGYSADFQTFSLIIDIDPATGAAGVPPQWADCPSNPPNVSLTGFMGGMAHVDGVLVGAQWAGSGPGAAVHLYYYDDEDCAASSTLTALPNSIGGFDIEALAYCPDNDRLYAVDWKALSAPHTSRLFEVDPVTGIGEVVGATMAEDVHILGMTCTLSGQLYAISGGFASRDAALFMIDRDTGVETQIALLNTQPQQLQSLHVHGDGNLYAAGEALFRINPDNGNATPVVTKGGFATVFGMSSTSVGNVGDGGADFTINAGISGSWFDPGTNGQGWLLEILTLPTKTAGGSPVDGLAVMYWFTFPPDKGVAAEQAWVVGVGSIQGDTITFEDAQITSGGMFGPGFDPGAVERSTWGDLVMSFSDCGNGSMSYVSKGGGAFGSGELPMERITSVEGLNCESLAKGLPPAKVSELDASFSGSWFDPDHDGEGWLIEILPGGLAVVYWFSYDGDGNQAWFVGVGEIDGKTITVDEVFIARGTLFGEGFDPDAVELVPWGSMEFTFDGCDSGSMSYASVKGGEFGSGSLDLERITSLAGLPCSE